MVIFLRSKTVFHGTEWDIAPLTVAFPPCQDIVGLSTIALHPWKQYVLRTPCARIGISATCARTRWDPMTLIHTKITAQCEIKNLIRKEPAVVADAAADEIGPC